jgi:hypothetical protein
VNNSNIAQRIASAQALEARFAHRLAARLSEGAESADADISERLRFAREKALERARVARQAAATPIVGASRDGSAVLGDGGGWWLKFTAVLPVIALVAGLVMIQQLHDNAQIATAAEIDADLLADDLPPSAYSDEGFAEFLKNTRE